MWTPLPSAFNTRRKSCVKGKIRCFCINTGGTTFIYVPKIFVFGTFIYFGGFMKPRKILSVIFFLLSLLFCSGSIAVSLLPLWEIINSRLAFLLFLPLWIISYWFSTFFHMAARKKTPEGCVYALKKKTVKILNGISNFLSFVLLVYWFFVYVKQFILYKHL